MHLIESSMIAFSDLQQFAELSANPLPAGWTEECEYLEEGDIELGGYTGGGGDLVSPCAVRQQAAGLGVNHYFLRGHHAQPKHKRPLHLSHEQGETRQDQA